MPGRHPDDDLLADLAADVLPVEQARVVEAHVLGCDRCAALLSDADRIRGLLMADDPGPVPPEVWSRVEAALSSAAATRDLTPEGAAPSAPSAPLAPVRPHETGGPAAWDGADPLDDPAAWDGAPSSASRSGPATVTGNLRRLTTSRRERRSERRARPAPLLLAAAATVAVLAVVGSVWGLRLAGSGGTSASAGAAAGSGSSSSVPAGSAAVAQAAKILRSGTDYTRATLRQQARRLVGSAGTGASSPAPGAAKQTDAAPEGATAPGPRGLASVAPDPRATDVTNPARLAACLSALNASADRVVAVDLARFAGREAAVLVLSSPAGGYEVWVVARTCHPGDEGTLSYATMPG